MRICSYKKVLFLLMTGICIAVTSCNPETHHEHNYSTHWTSNETYHWHESECGHSTTSDKAEHLWNDGIIEVPATCTTKGSKTYTCTICGKARTETIDAQHSWKVEDTTKSPTCTEEGVKTYKCSNCKTLKKESISALGHSQPPNYSYDNNNHWNTCSRCLQPISSTIGRHLITNHECNICGYKQNLFTISFNSNDGSVIPNQNIIEGEKAVKPTDPTKSHYYFAGWFKDLEFTEVFSFDDEIKEDMSLIAKWDYAEVTQISGVYYPGYWATVTWMDPEYEDFDHLVVCPGGFEWSIEMGGGQTIAKGTNSYTITGTLTQPYIFICTVDSKGNRSDGIQLVVPFS